MVSPFGITLTIMSFTAMFLVFLVSALPLHFSVRFLKGKTNFLKTALVTFIAGIIVSAIKLRFRLFGSLIAFLVMIWIYKEMFRLKWVKAFLAWLLQFVFVAIIYLIILFILALSIGISIITLI